MTPARRRGVTADSAMLLLGTAVTGLAAYAYIGVGTRALGAAAFAPVSVLWTLWAVMAAVLTFPLQHWIVRTFRGDPDGGGVAAAGKRIGVLVLVLAAATGIGCWGLRGRLFGSDESWYPLLAALVVVGAGLIGVLRGVLAGRGRYLATSSVIAGENLIRLVGAVIAAAVGAGALGFAAALAAGPVVGLWFPSAFRVRSSPAGATTGVSPLGFVGSAAGASLLAQIVLTSGPLVLALLHGSPAAVSSLFAALALFRAPNMLALGASVRVTDALSTAVFSGELARVRSVVNRVVAAAVVAVPLGWLVGAWVGPAILRLVFGPEVVLPALIVGAVAALNVLGLATLVQTLVLMARGRPHLATAAWAIGLGVMLVWLALAGGDPVSRVVWSLLAAEVVAFLALLGADRRAAAGLPVNGADPAAAVSLRP